MKKRMFQYGDYVVGNAKANNHYTQTRNGTNWVVVEYDNYTDIIFVMDNQLFDAYNAKKEEPAFIAKKWQWGVLADCFDFIRNLLITNNKDYVHVLDRYED